MLCYTQFSQLIGLYYNEAFPDYFRIALAKAGSSAKPSTKQMGKSTRSIIFWFNLIWCCTKISHSSPVAFQNTLGAQSISYL